MQYYDLDVSIERWRDDHYPTKAESSTMGEARGKLLLNLSSEETKSFLNKLANGTGDEEFLKRFGGFLFSLLFSGRVGHIYQLSLGQVFADDNAGLRIRLRIEPPEIAALPWELLYDETRDCFLATSTETLLTRYIEIPRPLRKLQTAPPINILVVIPRGSGLDVDQEERKILEALAELGEAVRVEVLKDRVTRDDIDRALNRTQFHIFHFIGHGYFDGETGCLVINAEKSERYLMTAREFAFFFQDYHCMKLVVLNSCSGAESATDALTGVAQKVVLQGVPAVVAMRKAIEDDAAKLFAAYFYLRLCQDEERGRVDIATAKARKRLIAVLEAGSDTFSTPVLFMRSPNGVIFDLPASASPMLMAKPTMSERDTLKAVGVVHEQNIVHFKTQGGEEAAADLAREFEALQLVRGRLRGWYKRAAISAAPRVAALGLVLTVVFFVAAHVNILSSLRVDDYFNALPRLWGGEVADKKFSPDIEIILADEEHNGALGAPGRVVNDEFEPNTKWRGYHATLIEALAAIAPPHAKPKAIVFDLGFRYRVPEYDGRVADAVRFAQSQNVPVVAAKLYNDNGNLDVDINDDLKPAFGNSWGDTNVGSTLSIPLLGKYANEYKIANIPRDARSTVDSSEIAVSRPSLALQAVIESRKEERLSAFYNELDSELVLSPAGASREPQIRVPVINRQGDLEMVLDIAPEDNLRSIRVNYEQAYAWATSEENRINTLERKSTRLGEAFGGKIVLIGYNTTQDTWRVLGEGERTGVEMHANAISNVLTGVHIRRLSGWINFLIIAAMVALGILLQTRLRRWLRHKIPFVVPKINKDLNVPALLVLIIVVYLIAAGWVSQRRGISFDISYHLAALLFGYWTVSIFRKNLRLKNPPEEA